MHADALSELGVATEEAEQLMPLYFHVLGLGDHAAVLQHVEPEQLRRQIFFAIRTVFERRLALSPLLIIVEDLHWADAVSLEAMRFLMDRLERTRLMLLFTHRPMLELDQFGSGQISHTTLRLLPLGSADGQRLLAAYFSQGWRESPGNLFSRILERASGNPLFIEEIIRGLIEAGALERDGAQWRVKSDEAAADIPASIQALLLARLDRLPHEVRRLAQEAAVIGPRFDAVLLGATATEPAKAEAGLELLCDAEIVEEVAGANSISLRSYRFTQTMLQDVIYQNLLLQRRIELHGRIGATLERLYGDNPERLEDLILLGHHFSLSASKPRGARYLGAAGDRARAIYANDDAIRLYQQAIAVLLTAGDQGTERLILYERIADLCGATGRRNTAEEHYQTALEAHRAAGDRVAEARILRKLGRLLWDAGKRDKAEAHYAEAATLLEGTDAPIEWAHLLQERGHLAFRMGDHAAAARWADEALAYARSCRRTWISKPDSKRRALLRRLSTPKVLHWRGSGDARRRCARWSKVSQQPKPPAFSTWHAAATLISACSTRWSTRRKPWRFAGAASMLRAVSAISASRRVFLPTLLSPAAPSRTDVPTRACRLPKRRSKSTVRWISASISLCP